MPDILDAVVSGTRDTKIEWEGLPILVTWTPSKLTGAAVEEVVVEKTVGSIARLLAEAVVAWDVTVGGVPVPCTAEGFLSVPLTLLKAVYGGLNEETSPSGEASGSFAAT